MVQSSDFFGGWTMDWGLCNCYNFALAWDNWRVDDSWNIVMDIFELLDYDWLFTKLNN